MVGFIFFKNNYGKYVIIYEVKEEFILDFKEIEGKENSFILSGNNNAFIIKDKKILNKINFDEGHYSSPSNNDYICQFKKNLYIISGLSYITFFNTNDNKFKKIKFLEKNKISIVYKYKSNSIILLYIKEIYIIQIINDEKIQINTYIKLGGNYDYHYLKFIYEEKSILLKESKEKWRPQQIYKLKFKSKFK